jgi:PTH1 family peptidyl-tRNA hydrolase
MKQHLLVGLGNPGPTYRETRHNAGFLLVDALLQDRECEPLPAHPLYLGWRVFDRERENILYLIKPLTFMNLSGNAVTAFLERVPVDQANILIAYDDVSLPTGTLRMRPKGSSGGQNGIKHIIATLDTQDIARLRIGVMAESLEQQSLVDFVLSPFHASEKPVFLAALAVARAAVETWANEGVVAAMSRYNGPVDPQSASVPSLSQTIFMGGDGG